MRRKSMLHILRDKLYCPNYALTWDIAVLLLHVLFIFDQHQRIAVFKAFANLHKAEFLIKMLVAQRIQRRIERPSAGGVRAFEEFHRERAYPAIMMLRRDEQPIKVIMSLAAIKDDDPADNLPL